MLVGISRLRIQMIFMRKLSIILLYENFTIDLFYYSSFSWSSSSAWATLRLSKKRNNKIIIKKCNRCVKKCPKLIDKNGKLNHNTFKKKREGSWGENVYVNFSCKT